MADEREVTIKISAKNLTQEEFDKARKSLAGVSEGAQDASKKTQSLKEWFLGAGGAANTMRTSLLGLASGFALGSLIERGVSSLASFASGAIESAGTLIDLRNATGVSLEMLQRWGHVADQGGITLENMTKAAFGLSVSLNGGNKSVREGVEKLGLSWRELRQLAPEQQLDQVLRAAKNLKDPQERNAALVMAFGEKGAIALSKIVDGYRDTAAAAKVAGDAQVEAINKADEAWAKFKKDLGTGFVQTMGNLVMGFTETGVAVDSLSAKERQMYDVLRKTGGEHLYLIQLAHERAAAVKAAEAAVQQAAKGSTAAQRDYVAELARTREELAALDPATRKQILAAQELNETEEALTIRFDLSSAAQRLLAEQKTKDEQATAKLAERNKAAHKVLIDFNEEIDKQNASFGRNMATIGDFTKEIEKHTERVGQGIIASALARKKYEDELDSIVRDRTMTRLDLEIDAIGRWAANEKLHLDRSAANWRAAADAIDAVAAKKISVLGEDDLLRQRIIFANLETDAKNTVSNVGHAFKDIGNVIVSAMQGGGSVLGAVGSSMGQALGKDLVGRFGTIITNTLGQTLGGAINAVIPGVGALLGPLIGKIAGLFTDQNTAEVRRYNAEIEKVHDSLLAQYGTLENLETAANRVGLSFRENWGHQGRAGLEATNDLIDEMERRIKAVDEASARSVSGFAAVAAGMTEPWRELGEQIREALQEADDTFAALQTLRADEGAGIDALTTATREHEAAVASLDALLRDQANAAMGARQELADLGVQAVGTFGAAMASGMSYAEAMRAVGPSIHQLAESYEALGLDVDDVAQRHLLLQATVAEGNPALIGAVSGLGDSMQGLAQLGLLNVNTFAAMQRTGSAMYARLQDEVARLGGDTVDALLPMQDYLHQAAIQADLLGIPLDDNTQRLIDQSRELGIWRDQGKTANDLLIEGMSLLVDKVGELLSHMLGVSGAINGLPERRDITINVTTNEQVNRNVTETRNGEGGEPGYAGGTNGAFPDFGDGTRVVLHHREAVVPERDKVATAQRWLGQAGAAAPAGGSPISVNVLVERGGRVRVLSEEEFILATVQGGFDQARLSVPERALAARTGR